MKRLIPYALSAITALAAVALVACEGTSTETVSGKTTGALYLVGGKPARGAGIRVLPVAFRPYQDSGKSEVYKTTTDNNGQYSIEALAKGDYNILGELDGELSIQDSIRLDASARNLASDTLEQPGSASGRVGLQPGDPLTTVTIQVLGTLAFVNVDEDGYFTLPDLAPGHYSMAISTTLPDYTDRYVSLTIRSGMHDTLPGLLGLIYNGIPQVLGLRATVDTLNQRVHLIWPKVKYPYTDDYLVFRDRKGAIQRSYEPIDAVADTEYTDSFAAFRPFLGSFSKTVNQWEYRVVIRDKFGNSGRSFGSLAVPVPAADFVTSFLETRIANAKNLRDMYWQTSVGDTVFLIFHASNRTRGHQRIRWFVEGTNGSVRTVEKVERDVLDTLKVICPATPITRSYQAEITDSGGAEWRDQVILESVWDAPVVDMPTTYTGSPEQFIKIHGGVSNMYGKIVKVEWMFGSGPWSDPTMSNDTGLTIPAIGLEHYRVVIKVTDDDGQVGSDSTFVSANPWRHEENMPDPVSGAAMVTIAERIYALGGLRITAGTPSDAVRVLNTGTGRWVLGTPMPTARVNFASAAVNGKIYVMGGHKDGAFLSPTHEYSPETDTWAVKANMPHPRVDGDIAVHDGKIYVFGGYTFVHFNTSTPTDQVDVYDPATDIWTSFASPIPVWGAIKTASIGNEVYAFAVGLEKNGEFAKYDFISDTWTHLGRIPKETDKGEIRPFDYSVTAVSGKILVAGGMRNDNSIWWLLNGREFSLKTFVYKPDVKDWDGITDLTRGASGCGLAVVEDRLYVIGGTVSKNFYYGNPNGPTDSWTEIDDVYSRIVP
ncbi:MAG: kelch repeat-containing protein [Fibrobacteria bacterium]